MAYFPPKIVISGRLLTFYEAYDEYKEALNTAKWYQKKYHNRYFILIKHSLLGNNFGLYMNKVYRPWSY